MEKQPEKPRGDAHQQQQQQHHHHHHRQEKEKEQPPPISIMVPATEGAYGGGMYGTEVGQAKQPVKAPASDTQSADGPVGPNIEPKHKPPPPSGDRDIDITGQSYIQ